MTTLVKWVTPLAALAIVGALAVPVQAQDGDLKGELLKAVENGAKSAGDEIGKLLNEKGKSFVDEILKVVERRTGERIAKLEPEIKDRDKRIGELEAKVKELTAKPTPPTPPVAAPAKPSNTFLGVGHIDVPPELRTKHKIEGGALLTQVLEESPAAAAGLTLNDIIVEIQGTPVNSANLSSVVAGLKVDQEVNITYLRDGNRATKAVKLADREKYFAARAAKSQPAPAKKEPVVLGVLVQEKDGGLVVESVEDGFTGSTAGLKAGDKITHLNGKELKTLEDVQGELKKLVDGDKLVIAFSRGEEKVTVSVLGAHGKGGAKVLASESVKPKPKEEPKPAEKKPGFLGVSVVEDAHGVVVDDVVADTAAAAAGLKKGDLVRKVNGKEIADVDALKGLLGGIKAGDKVSLELLREGKPVEVKDLELKASGEKVSKAEQVAAAPKKEEPKPPAPKAKQKGYLGILATQTVTNQIVVKSVNPGGAGEKAELKVGDVILKINDKPVASFDDLTSVLAPLFAGDSIQLRIKRGNEEKDVKVTLGEV